jgi:hypothetical protein
VNDERVVRLRIHRDRQAAEVRAGGDEPLARFLAYVERLAATRDQDTTNLLLLEVFEDGEWVGSVADRFGPHTRTLLQQSGLLPVTSGEP